jgi:hypothetical protein
MAPACTRQQPTVPWLSNGHNYHRLEPKRTAVRCSASAELHCCVPAFSVSSEVISQALGLFMVKCSCFRLLTSVPGSPQLPSSPHMSDGHHRPPVHQRQVHAAEGGVLHASRRPSGYTGGAAAQPPFDDCHMCGHRFPHAWSLRMARASSAGQHTLYTVVWQRPPVKGGSHLCWCPTGTIT